MKLAMFAFCCLIFLSVTEVTGAENDFLTSATRQFSLLSGYGITHRGYGATRSEVQTFDLILRYGHFLSDEIGKNHWYQGRHELLLELPYHMAVNRSGRSMVGANVLGCWLFTGTENFVPYLFVGGGILYVDAGIASMGSRLNGTYQAGGGVQHFISSNVAFFGEYRYHHISNLGTDSPNEPLNSSKLLFGVAVYR